MLFPSANLLCSSVCHTSCLPLTRGAQLCSRTRKPCALYEGSHLKHYDYILNLQRFHRQFQQRNLRQLDNKAAIIIAHLNGDLTTKSGSSSVTMTRWTFWGPVSTPVSPGENITSSWESSLLQAPHRRAMSDMKSAHALSSSAALVPVEIREYTKMSR